MPSWQTMRAVLKRTIGEQVRLEVRVAPDLRLIRADRRRIEQVLTNLSVNSRDAMPDGGVLTMRTALVEGQSDEAKPHPGIASGPDVRSAVIDEGVGMSADVVERVRKVTVTMLRRNGYRVRHAADATTALLISADIDFDLLLTDVVMPQTSGRELVSALRDRHRTCQVLFMSGYSGGAFGSERVLEGVEALIHETFKETELLQAVHDALHRSGTSRRSP